MLIHGINIKRPVDRNLKPIKGNPICEFFTFENIEENRRGWYGVKDGWMPYMAAQFMSDHYYYEYTNIKSVEPEKTEDVMNTVKHRLVSLIRSLVTDKNKGRPWGFSNYSLKNLHRTHGNRVPKKAEDTGVTCENGPRDKEPKQMTMDFESSFPDVVVSEKVEKKPRTYKRLPLVKGEPEKECKTKDKVIDDIRHWQVENQKILHAEHGDINAKVTALSATVNKLSDAIDKMDAKLNMVVAMSYNIDRLFKMWKPLPGKKA